MPISDSLERAWKRQRVDTASFLLGVGAAASAAAAGLGIWWWAHRSQLHINGRQSQHDMPVDDLADVSREMDSPGAMHRPLRQAETVLQRRRLDVICVLHYPAASKMQDALRVCEALGVQHVYVVDQPVPEKKPRPWEAHEAKLRRQATPAYMSCDAATWLSIRRFTSAEDCVKALQQQRSPIWLPSTAQSAQPLATAAASLSRLASRHEDPQSPLNEGMLSEAQAGADGDTVQAQPAAIRAPLAIVFAQGELSAAYSDAAERNVYFSLSGFTQSLPSVAAMAVLLHQITALMARPGAQQQPQSLSEEHLQLRLQWYRQLAGDDADLLKQYTDMVQQPLAPFADLRMHSSRRDDKQTAIGSPTGVGASPLGKAGQTAAAWQQRQPTPDSLGGGWSSSQAQLANGLHSRQAADAEAAAAAATNGDPGAGSSSASPSSASPTANGWGPKSPSFARPAAGADRSSSVAAGAGTGPIGSQRTPQESPLATVPTPKSSLSDSRAGSMTGTPRARLPPAAPSVFQDRLDGGAEASRGPSGNQVTPSRRSNIAAGSPFAQLPSPAGGRAAAGSPFAQPPSPANSGKSSVTGTSGPPHSYVPWASQAVAPPNLGFKSPKSVQPSSQSSSPLSQSAAYPPASRFSPTSSMNLPNEVFSPPSPGAASTASSVTTQPESADRARRRSQVFRRQMGGRGPASHALSSAMSSNLDRVQVQL